MADTFVIETLGDWGKQIEIPLERALTASMTQFGYTAERASKQLLIFEAQSAKNLAPKAQPKRPVFHNPHFAHLMRKRQYKVQRERGADMARYYKYSAIRLQQHGKPAKIAYGNKEKPLAKIGHRGTAQRSWVWGLGPIGYTVARGPIPGTIDLYTINAKQDSSSVVAGYVLTDKLSYLPKIMPPGWKQQAEQAGVNRVLGNVRQALRNEVTTAMVKGWAQ